MSGDVKQVAWIADEDSFSLAQLAQLAGTSEELLRELVEWGAIVPRSGGGGQWVFTGATVATVRMACRLGSDLELEPQGMALAYSLLDRIRRLEAELASLRALRSP
jgi:chaperone modulatory protein CbpM